MGTGGGLAALILPARAAAGRQVISNNLMSCVLRQAYQSRKACMDCQELSGLRVCHRRWGAYRPVAPRLVVDLRVGAVLAAVDAVGVQAEERVGDPAGLRAWQRVMLELKASAVHRM